jgi:hypothetical protein
MQVTLSDWTWRRHLAFKRLAEKSKRDAERFLNGPWVEITCGQCGHEWDQTLLEPEEELKHLPDDAFEGMKCSICRSPELVIDRTLRYRQAP